MPSNRGGLPALRHFYKSVSSSFPSGWEFHLPFPTDYLIGLGVSKYNSDPINLSLIKKVKQIEKLPPGEKRALIKTIDKYINSVGS